MSTVPMAVMLPSEPVKVVRPVELPPIHEPEPPFHGGLLVNEPVKIAVASYTYNNSPKFVQAPEPDFSTPQFADEYRYEGINAATDAYDEITKHSVNKPVKVAAASYNSSPKFVQAREPDYGTPQFTDEFENEDMKVATEAYEEITKNRVNKHVISMSAWTPSKINQADFTLPVEKPPASARFSHRKPAKATTEGGRTLGVAKPKRQDTLETTWKTITEGRSVPLTRHLRKSDTWETHGQGRHSRNSEDSPIDHHPERMTKSDTFDVNRGGGSSRKPPATPSKLSRSGGSGRLRKDPSLGQEELNRKVEAFIKKFNEDMRLQRQESLNQYMEMINRGAH